MMKIPENDNQIDSEESLPETDRDPQQALYCVQAILRLSSLALLRPMKLEKFLLHHEYLQTRKWLSDLVGDQQAQEAINEWINSNLYFFEK